MAAVVDLISDESNDAVQLISPVRHVARAPPSPDRTKMLEKCKERAKILEKFIVDKVPTSQEEEEEEKQFLALQTHFVDLVKEKWLPSAASRGTLDSFVKRIPTGCTLCSRRISSPVLRCTYCPKAGHALCLEADPPYSSDWQCKDCKAKPANLKQVFEHPSSFSNENLNEQKQTPKPRSPLKPVNSIFKDDLPISKSGQSKSYCAAFDSQKSDILTEALKLDPSTQKSKTSSIRPDLHKEKASDRTYSHIGIGKPGTSSKAMSATKRSMAILKAAGINLNSFDTPNRKLGGVKRPTKFMTVPSSKRRPVRKVPKKAGRHLQSTDFNYASLQRSVDRAAAEKRSNRSEDSADTSHTPSHDKSGTMMSATFDRSTVSFDAEMCGETDGDRGYGLVYL